MSKKILIIDDEPSLLNILVDLFNQKGFKVSKAKDGKQGLKIALSEHPDIILLDIIMPVMDGMTMLYTLRKDDWGKNAKVILLTNLSDSVKEIESLNQGVFDYLVKSNWTLEDIVARVKERIKN